MSEKAMNHEDVLSWMEEAFCDGYLEGCDVHPSEVLLRDYREMWVEQLERRSAAEDQQPEPGGGDG